MITILQKTYEQTNYPPANLTGAAADVARLDIGQTGTIEKVTVTVGANVSGDAVFAVYLNGAEQTAAAITIPSGAKKGASAAVTIAVVLSDEIVLRRVSGTITAAVNLIVSFDDGISSGGTPQIVVDDTTQGFVIPEFAYLYNATETSTEVLRTASGTGWAQSEAATANVVHTGRVIVEAKINYEGMVGLSIDNSNGLYTSIQYGVNLTASLAGCSIYEGGTSRGGSFSLADGDLVEWRVTKQLTGKRVLDYFINGVFLYRSNLSPTQFEPSKPNMLFDMALYTEGHPMKKPYFLIDTL